jgi:hypothetical protein
MNAETGAGILVPVDCKENILSAKKNFPLEKVDEFEAKSRHDMMTQYYDAMGWGEYKTRAEIRAERAKKTGTTTSTSKHHTTTTKTYTPKPKMYEVIREQLDRHPNSDQFMRPRPLLEEWGRPMPLPASQG